jgi:ribosomal protein S18 acetylase RimI-like enzyme
MDDHISKAGLHDLHAILQLVNSAYRGDSAKKGWTHEADLIKGAVRTNLDTLKEMIGNPDAVILIYKHEEKIIGSVYLEKKQDALYLGMLTVDPNIQAQGIGKKLLRAAEEQAKIFGCSSIEMTVISVRIELIEWYKRNGYVDTGETKPFPQDERFGIPAKPIEFTVLAKQL